MFSFSLARNTVPNMLSPRIMFMIGKVLKTSHAGNSTIIYSIRYAYHGRSEYPAVYPLQFSVDYGSTVSIAIGNSTPRVVYDITTVTVAIIKIRGILYSLCIIYCPRLGMFC